ncbi:MAG: hypothetical protein JNM64_11985 [Chloroflexia bacterium]|nr:hypothetical protein [Chloroflexia bacterium]
MDDTTFDDLILRLASARLTRATALRGLAAGALGAAAGIATPAEARHRTKKRKSVCLCPTAQAASCTTRKARKKQARKLASQACNYAGKCQPGVVGPQCPPPTTTTPRPGCAGGACRVFVTSQTYSGNLKQYDPANASGLAGADAICQGLAEYASLPGTYKAWLSDSTGASPATRFVKSTDPYVLVDGTRVADNWTDLTTCQTSDPHDCLAHAIDRTEIGSAPATVVAATYTLSSGAAGSATIADAHCNNWSSDTGGLWGTGGLATTSLAGWTLGNANTCVSGLHLYCFQQR